MLKRQPGITFVQRVTGGNIILFYRDPRKPDKKKRGTNFALGSNDDELANTVAEQLSRLIKNPNLSTDDMHAMTKKAWVPVEGAQTALDDTHLAIYKAPRYDPDESRKPGLRTQDPSYQRWFALFKQFKKLQKEVKGLLLVKADRDRLAVENIQLKARLRKMDVKAVLDASPISIKDAIPKFFQSGKCEATGNWRYALKTWFERLAKDVGEDTNVHKLTPEVVRDHINKQKCNSETKRRLKINLCNFLRFATSENFDERTLTELTSDLKKKAKQENNKAWYWLTRKQALQIIKNLKKQVGQFVADAVLLQYATGIRSEEIPLLQRLSVKKEKRKLYIHIARIFDGAKLVRKVKTEKSEDYVEVPSFALPALKRRMKGTEFLLFPCLKPDEWMAPRFAKALTDFERANKLWYVPPHEERDDHDKTYSEYAWSEFYTPLLRKAAVGVKDVKLEEIDARTMRRTCGRELIIEYGFDRAASVLRDDITTLRAHYADLKSSDTSTER